MALDTRSVTCSVCGKTSQIMAPEEGVGAVEWKCPAPGDNGIDLCGAANVVDA